MQSSRNTTDSLTADQLNDALTRRLKKASASIAKRKLQTGEYVQHNGKIVPAYVLEEAAAESTSTSIENVAAVGFDLRYEGQSSEIKPFVPLSVDGWFGSPKSKTATSVEIVTRRPGLIMAAAPIKHGRMKVAPRDGQLFKFDGKTGKIIPVEGQSRSTVKGELLVSPPKRKRIRIDLKQLHSEKVDLKVK